MNMAARTGAHRGRIVLAGMKADTGSRKTADDAIVLGVLDAIERDPAVTQRSLAGELGIALGLANAYLRRCVRKGLVKVSQVPRRRYAYYVTPRGFAEKSRLTAQYLSDSFSFFRRARAQCSELLGQAAAQGQRRVLLLGAGDLAEIALLVSREHAVDIAGVVAAARDASTLAGDAAAFGHVDRVIVTELERAKETFDAARAVFGPERVHAPALLRLRVDEPPASRQRSATA